MALSQAVKNRIYNNRLSRSMRLAWGPGLSRADARAKLVELDRRMMEAIRDGKPFGEVFYPTVVVGG